MLNLAGLDYWGRPFSAPTVAVAAGEVLSLWVAVVVPPTVAGGSYRGTATVTFRSAGSTAPGPTPTPTAGAGAGGAEGAGGAGAGRQAAPLRAGPVSAVAVTIELAVAGALLPDGGDADPTRGTRLHWLDSTEGLHDDTVPAPFTPIRLTKFASGRRGAALNCTTQPAQGPPCSVAAAARHCITP